MLTDTHCHLYYKDLKKDLQGVFDRANKLGVNRFICAATNMEDVHQCIEIAENYDQVFCSSGIHPHDTKDAPKNYIEKIYNLMSNDNMVAIGEIGLDYYRNISDSNIQKKRLREQLKIALEIELIKTRVNLRRLPKVLRVFFFGRIQGQVARQAQPGSKRLRTENTSSLQRPDSCLCPGKPCRHLRSPAFCCMPGLFLAPGFEQFENDPQEFVRRAHDPMEDFFEPRAAAGGRGCHGLQIKLRLLWLRFTDLVSATYE